MATSSFGQSLSSQARIVYACSVRLLKMKTRETPLGVFSAWIEPMATICVMTIVFTNVRFKVPKLGDYVMLFLMTGILPITLFKQSAQGAGQAFGRLKRVVVMPQVQPLDAMLAGVMNAFLILSTLFMAITIFFAIVYDVPWPQNLVFCFIPAFCNAMFGWGLGMINMVIKTWWAYWGTIFSVITAPVGIMSGMFYTIENIPVQVQKYLFYNPLMHSTELIRTYFYADYTSSFFDPYYYYGVTFGTLMVGLMCERIFRYRLLHQSK